MRQGLLVVGAVVEGRPIECRSVVKAWLPEVGGEPLSGGPCGGARAWSIVLEPRGLTGGCRRYVCGKMLIWMLVACGPRGGGGGCRRCPEVAA